MTDSSSRQRLPTQFASKRDWPFRDLQSAQSSDLQDCWKFSRDTFNRARTELDAIEIDSSIISTLVVAGSLGRMEAQDHSDCDLLIFLHNDRTDSDPAVAQQTENIWTCLQRSGLRLPKPWGIFASAGTANLLVQPDSLGNLNESREVFGKRIQTLLDCQPLWGEHNFEKLQQSVLQWYATAFVNDGDHSQWRYLLTDLIRYYKSYSAWHQFKLTIEHDDSWFIRDAKLRSSRLLMYTGLLLQISTLSWQTDNKVEALRERMYLTPLERVIQACQHYDLDDDDIARIVSSYNVYYKIMADADNRLRLVDGAPQQIEQLGRIDNDIHADIDRACSQLKTVLTQFVLQTQSRCHPDFFEDLLF